MADRDFGNRTFGNVRAPVRINLSWAIAGAVGAVGVIRGAATGNKVTSVVRDSAGVYIITLDDKYVQLYAHHGTIFTAGAAVDMYVQGETWNATPAATGATIQVRCMTANVETDPPNLAEVFVELILSNSGLDP